MRWLAASALAFPLIVASWSGCATSGVSDGLEDDAGGTGEEEDTGTTPTPHDAGRDQATHPLDAQPPGFDAAPVDASPNQGDGSSASCASPNDCSGADAIGNVSGDTTSNALTATGFTSKWFQVDVTEDDSSATKPRKLNVSVSLVSPPGVNYDLFLYVETDGSTTSRACSTVSASSTNATGADVASLNWGEGGILPNGKDDGRIVSVEVRWVSGACAPNDKWTLTISGN